MNELFAGRTRRSLLGTLTLLPAGARGGSAANSVVSVGLIGCGGRGMLDAKLLLEHTDARVTAFCDVVEQRIEKAKSSLAPQARAYQRIEELLASDVDAVIIATPVYLHPEQLERAVRAGKHVYIEKPAAADLEGCKRVIRAADSAAGRLNITFGFQQRYGPGYRKAHQLATSGALGKIRFAHSHWIKGAVGTNATAQVERPRSEEEKLRQWKVWRETFGDFIVETYCHGVDVLNWFLGGHPEKASASGTQTVITRGDMRDHCSATFTYPGGIQATLSGSQIAPAFHRDVQERFYFPGDVLETAREYWKHYRSKTEILHEKEPRDITADALAEFVARVREKRYENTGISAAHTTMTAIMARESMDRGREVSWQEIAG